MWSSNWNKKDQKHRITSKVTLVLFTHVFLRGHYLSMICSHSLDSVIRGSSDLHQSKVYLSSGLFEIVTQSDYIPLLKMKDCSQNYSLCKMLIIWTRLNRFKSICGLAVFNFWNCLYLFRIFWKQGLNTGPIVIYKRIGNWIDVKFGVLCIYLKIQKSVWSSFFGFRAVTMTETFESKSIY